MVLTGKQILCYTVIFATTGSHCTVFQDYVTIYENNLTYNSKNISLLVVLNESR